MLEDEIRIAKFTTPKESETMQKIIMENQTNFKELLEMRNKQT